MKLKYTAEQEAILAAFEDGDNIKIQAGAGAAKTTTCIAMADRKEDDDGLYLAYNKAIQTEASGRFPFSTDAVTTHALAFRAVGVDYKHRLNAKRLPIRETARILGAKPFQIGEHPVLGEFAISRMVNEAVRRFTYSTDTEIGMQHVEPVKGYSDIEMAELQSALAPLLRAAWADLRDIHGKLWFSHDHYLAIWCMQNPELRADFIFLDEAQDTTPRVAQMFEQQAHAQRVAVGDSSQQIYAWRGAVDALATLYGREMHLTQSFRFGDAIAREANDWLDILGAPIRLSGFDQVESAVVSSAPDAGTVLCRTNMGCMGEAISLMDSGHKVAVVGGAQQLQDLANACIELQDTGKTAHPELIAFGGWEEVREYSEDREGADLKPLVQMVDRYTPKYLLARTRQFVDERDADRIVSTAHKAKGREWVSVRLGDDFHQEPGVDAATGAALPIEITREEAMLNYVAITRAKNILDAGALSWFQFEPVVIV